jgi:hypothetical protein
MKTTKSQQRKADIIEYLSENGASTRSDVLAELAISDRTFDRDLSDIKKEGIYTIQSILHNNERKYKITHKVYVDLDEQEVLSLPILFNLVNMQKELESVLWLKYVLQKHYGINESDWEKDIYFSSPSTSWKHESNVLNLSIDLIKAIKNQNVISFKYKPVTPNKPIEDVVLAPLQVRLYDGRYYLVGAVQKNGEFGLSILKIMAIDQIRNWRFTLVKNRDSFVYFNYSDLVAKCKLNTYFKYCIGVTVPLDMVNKIPQPIKIRFLGWAKSYVKNKKLHDSQIEINNQDDYVDIQIEVYETFELDFVLGRFREFAQRLQY